MYLLDLHRLVFAGALASITGILWLFLKMGRPQQMKLHRFVFSEASLRTLSEPEQLYFVRLAHFRNDLRLVEQLCFAASHGKMDQSSVETSIRLHQTLFGLRLHYGLLNEGWKVIQSGWSAAKLGIELSKALPPEIVHFHSELNRYFSGTNLVRSVRDGFSFHYLIDKLEPGMDVLSPEDELGFVSGKTHANIFYDFAELIHNTALAKFVGLPDPQSAVRKLYDEGLANIGPKIEKLSDAILLHLADKLSLQTGSYESSEFMDLREARMAIFIDEGKMAPNSQEAQD